MSNGNSLRLGDGRLTLDGPARRPFSRAAGVYAPHRLIERASEELNANQAFFPLRIATALKGGVADLARGRLESPQVEILAENYLTELLIVRSAKAA